MKRARISAAIAGLVLLLLCLGPSSVFAQSGTYFNQRDDQYRLLGLKRAKEAYDFATTEYERQKELFEKGLISNEELDRAKSTFSDAEVNYLQSLLAVLFERQYVTVLSATKYLAANGAYHVKLVIANASGGSAEFRKLLNIDDPLFRSLQPDVINDVYVSLLNDRSSIVSMPYETKVSQLTFGEPVETDFQLLEDLDNVSVSLTYGSGSQRMMKIFLQKDTSTNQVALKSEQFSQLVDFGSVASYDIELELYSGSGKNFSLAALGLPAGISWTFKDPSGGAQLSQVKFSEASRSRNALLEIRMPQRPDDSIQVGRPIRFFAAAVPTAQLAEVNDGSSGSLTVAQLKAGRIGFVELELVPRGAGRLLVRASQLLQTIKSGSPAVTPMEVVNEGSGRLDNIEFEIDLPFGWTKRFEGGDISFLDVGGESSTELILTPPDDVSPGRYDIRLRATAQSNGQAVAVQEKTLTVVIESGGNVVGTIVIVLLIVALVGGMVVFGLKLSRK